MILGTGCDLSDIRRIERILSRFERNFLLKILTPAEQKNLHGCKAQYVAGRFAAKEACAKALGTGFQQGLTFTDLEILTDQLGAPCLYFHGQAKALAHRLGVKKSFVSISHERNYALAFVILEG
ncbi:MAG: holo-ACP synthase [Desulfovibrio sp.]|nr:holo-ACP synthase [Desulfovibrio sp.]